MLTRGRFIDPRVFTLEPSRLYSRSPAAGAPKRFMKRGELEKLRLDKEVADKQAREERKLAAEAESAGLFSKPAAAVLRSPVLVDLPVDEVIRRLRKLRKPITYVSCAPLSFPRGCWLFLKVVYSGLAVCV